MTSVNAPGTTHLSWKRGIHEVFIANVTIYPEFLSSKTALGDFPFIVCKTHNISGHICCFMANQEVEDVCLGVESFYLPYIFLYQYPPHKKIE